MAERSLPDESQGRQCERCPAEAFCEDGIDRGAPEKESQGTVRPHVAFVAAVSIFCVCLAGGHRGKYLGDGDGPIGSRGSRHHGYSSKSRYHGSTNHQDECEWLLYPHKPARGTLRDRNCSRGIQAV